MIVSLDVAPDHLSVEDLVHVGTLARGIAVIDLEQDDRAS